MKELITRTITGIVFILVLLGSLYTGHIAFAVLFLFVALLGLNEFYRIASMKKGVYPARIFGFITGGLVYISVALVSLGLLKPVYLFINLVFVILFLLRELSRKSENPAGNAAIGLLGILYVVIPLSLMNVLVNPGLEYNSYLPGFMLGFLILIWTYDVFAYLIGTIIGKHKLSQNISPQKTWEGSIGSGLITLAVSYVVSLYISFYDWYEWGVIALITVVFGTFGDIVESMLKRSVHIKDAGKILPGHGGILDRFDGILFIVPVLIIYILLIQ